VLRLGGAEVKISYLELFDNEIGPRGALALGVALSKGHNLSLLTLKLDFNTQLGNTGIANLCRGLRTNYTLYQLHLKFCGITAEGGAYIAEVLANARSQLQQLFLDGNKLGGGGLFQICRGLMVNTVLQKLSIRDIMLDQVRTSVRETIRYLHPVCLVGS
jgi:Ran GTPase-activating protein (RanGAP) involved in mRNA processing and transport